MMVRLVRLVKESLTGAFAGKDKVTEVGQKTEDNMAAILDLKVRPN